jgi:hypothetical protein
LVGDCSKKAGNDDQCYLERELYLAADVDRAAKYTQIVPILPTANISEFVGQVEDNNECAMSAQNSLSRSTAIYEGRY